MARLGEAPLQRVEKQESNLSELQQAEKVREQLKTIISKGQKVQRFGGNVSVERQQFAQAQENLPKYEKYIKEKKEYEEKVRQQEEYNNAYQAVMRAYSQGMLWAYAGFGSDIEKKIAKDLIRSGYEPALGGIISTERYQQSVKDIKELKDKAKELGINPNQDLNKIADEANK
jgi:hypothetical protein